MPTRRSRSSAAVLALAVAGLINGLYLQKLEAAGQTTDATPTVKVTGTIHENSQGTQANLVFLVPQGPEAQAIFECVSRNPLNTAYDDCKDQIGAAIAAGKEHIVSLQRTGPQDQIFEVTDEIPVGKYLVFMFGMSRGNNPATGEPFEYPRNDVKFIDVTTDKTRFDLDFWIG